jgi:hypothetical protein
MSEFNWQDKARLMAELLIEVANSEAEMGSVSGTMFDALGDVYAVFVNTIPDIAIDAQEARKNMRQTEWGNEFKADDFDLELDPEWVEY